MNNKIKLILIAILFIVSVSLISIGVVLSLGTNSSSSNKDYALEKEERYVNNKLVESATYKYNDKDIVKSMSLLYGCKDSENCGFMQKYGAGLYEYKYNFKDDVLENYVKIEQFSHNGVSIYLDKNLKEIKKYGYDAILLNEEDKTTEVKYEYDNDKLIKRTAYDNPICMIDEFTECDEDEVQEEASTVTFKYEKDNLKERILTYKNGSTYKNSYSYDHNNNVTKFVVDYSIKSEDDIIVDSDTYEGKDDYKGTFTINYDYKYKGNKIDTINMDVNLNNDYKEKYEIKRTYDNKGNMVNETVSLDGKEIYKRVLQYRKVNYGENEYLYKLNKLQTASDSLAEYLYTEDNWLQYYYLYM